MSHQKGSDYIKLSDAIKQNISILDYAQQAGYTPVRVNTNRYILKEHDSLVIKPQNNLFFWNSQNKSGSVIDFAQALKGISKSEAYDELTAMLNNPAYKSKHEFTLDHIKEKPTQPNKLEFPPATNGKFNRMYAYLLKTRGIEKAVIDNLVNRKLLYEDERHNVTFVGYDYDGTAKYGFKRGTATTATPYKRELAGSNELNKQIGWFINNNSNKLFVNEACIDSMSIMSILHRSGVDFNKYSYLPLGGTYINCLKYHLIQPQNAHINCIYLATDNDEAGANCRSKIKKMLKSIGFKGKVIEKVPCGKDWNDDLISIKNNKQNLKNNHAQQNQTIQKERVIQHEFFK